MSHDSRQRFLDATEEAFRCSYCGGPYRAVIPVGIVQVECEYCGSTVLVPPRLGKSIRRCPQHPDRLSAGLCDTCGQTLCDQCLYRLDAGATRCQPCLETQQVRREMVAVFGGFALILAGIWLATFPYMGSRFAYVIFQGVALILLGTYKPKYQPLAESTSPKEEATPSLPDSVIDAALRDQLRAHARLTANDLVERLRMQRLDVDYYRVVPRLLHLVNDGTIIRIEEPDRLIHYALPQSHEPFIVEERAEEEASP